MITVTALPTASTLVKYTPLREVMLVKSVSPPVVVYKWRSETWKTLYLGHQTHIWSQHLSLME